MPRKKKVETEEIEKPKKLNPELESDHPVEMLSEENRKRAKHYMSICIWCEHGQKCGPEVCAYGVAERSWGRY